MYLPANNTPTPTLFGIRTFQAGLALISTRGASIRWCLGNCPALVLNKESDVQKSQEIDPNIMD